MTKPHTPAIYFDVTMLVESRGPAHGILRVLRETAAQLATSTDNLVPCFYDEQAKAFRSLLNWPELMTARDQLGDVSRRPFIGHPSLIAPAANVNSRPLAKGFIKRLPVEVRGPVAKGLRDAASSVREFSSATRQILLRRPGPSPKLGERLQFGRGDVLLQPGAQWQGIGILEELRRASSTGAQIVTLVYDAIPILNPEFVGPAFTELFTAWFRTTLSTSHSILAISHAVKADTEMLARNWGIACPPVSVLRLGDDSFPPAPAEVSPALAALAKTPFVVCIGTIEIRKNHRLLAQVWRRLAKEPGTPRLVIVGKSGWLVEETNSFLERDLALKPHLTVVQGASDTDLAWLVSKAMFSVFPSMIEGWGLPVGEALAAGKIVIASDVPSVIEAGQGLAIHLPPDDVLAWTNTIRALTDDPERRARMEADIRSRFKVYPWSQTARDLANHVQRVIDGRDQAEPAAAAAPAVSSSAS